MAFEVAWTEPAESDVSEITATIRSDNPSAAERFQQELLDRVASLGRVPRLGAVYRRRRGYEVRQIAFRRYRIFYRVHPRLNLILVLRVWHGARREPSLP